MSAFPVKSPLINLGRKVLRQLGVGVAPRASAASAATMDQPVSQSVSQSESKSRPLSEVIGAFTLPLVIFLNRRKSV
jgi:hypothetical protein